MVRIVEDLCTTVDPMIHAIAISALRDRVEVVEREFGAKVNRYTGV